MHPVFFWFCFESGSHSAALEPLPRPPQCQDPRCGLQAWLHSGCISCNCFYLNLRF
jgi:hypothetical protein